MRKLTTKNLCLRPLKPRDITAKYCQALNNPQIVGLTESRYKKWKKEEIIDYVKKANDLKKNSLLIGIFLKNANKHIGNVRLHGFHAYNKRVELGIMIFDQNEWGKGYGTESLKVISRYVLNDLKLHKITAEYYSVNQASAKMFKKAGYQIEGVLKDHFLVNGKWIDAVRIAKFSAPKPKTIHQNEKTKKK